MILTAKPSAIAVFPTPGSPISIGLFFFLPSARSASSNDTYTGVLTPLDSTILHTYNLEINDKVYWEYRTFDNPFDVMFMGGPNILSTGGTSDNGSFTVAISIPHGFLIWNLDLLESGSYEVVIRVNPDSNSIPGFHLLFILLGIISIIVIKGFRSKFHR